MNWKRKHVVVTGGLGFVGSHLVEAMLSKGASVAVVDTSGIRPRLYKKKMQDYTQTCKKLGTNTDYHDIDLQFEPQRFRKVAKKADAVFHLAALFGGRGFVDKQQTECTAMFAVDQNVFRMCLEEGVERVHYASSACVYPNELQNDRSYLLKEEDAGPYRGWDSADNIYGWAKLLGERELQIMHSERGLKASSCRFLTVYGPREYDDSHAIAALINRSIRKEDPFVVWGDGKQERGFTYVRDIVSGVILASEKVIDGTPLNLGVSWRVSVKEVVDMIHGLVGFRPSRIIYDIDKPVGPVSRALDISKSTHLLGWEPRMGIQEGLKNTVEWHIANIRYLTP
jgi:nucleoside-diphosphate-sugar epimerase